ncbi:MAG: hypothetical protein ACM3KR_07465 [Deltaproteobacteria bacterium]
MKKLFLPTLLLILTVTLTACGGAVNNTEGSKSAVKPESLQNQVANQPASPEKAEELKTNPDAKTSDGNLADKSTVSGNKLPKGEKAPTKQNNISVITKSDNAVSSAEKEKVLKDLDSEISVMLKDVEKLDEVSDTDLAE